MVQKKSDCRMNEIRTRDAFDAAHGKLRWTAAKGLDLSNVGLAGWKRAAIEQIIHHRTIPCYGVQPVSRRAVYAGGTRGTRYGTNHARPCNL